MLRLDFFFGKSLTLTRNQNEAIALAKTNLLKERVPFFSFSSFFFNYYRESKVKQLQVQHHIYEVTLRGKTVDLRLIINF